MAGSFTDTSKIRQEFTAKEKARKVGQTSPKTKRACTIGAESKVMITARKAPIVQSGSLKQGHHSDH
jgi:hypothetical protein